MSVTRRWSSVGYLAFGVIDGDLMMTLTGGV